MKFTKTFREVYEPYLSKLGYFWYKKYFVRVDSKQELLSVVCHRTYRRCGITQYPISVGVAHIPLGCLDVDHLEHHDFDSISDMLHRYIEMKANRKIVRFCADDSNEQITQKAFESTLDLFMTYCPDLFEVGDMPDNLKVYNRIRDRLIAKEQINAESTQLAVLFVYDFETYIWIRDFDKARDYCRSRLKMTHDTCASSIQELETKIAQLNGAAESLNDYERDYMIWISKNSERKRKFLELNQSQIVYWIKHKSDMVSYYNEILDALDNNPELLRDKIDVLRKENLSKILKFRMNIIGK
jgi:hypothetical protein